MRIVVEETDKTVFWIECLMEPEVVKSDLCTDLLAEATDFLQSLLPKGPIAVDFRSPDGPIIR
jgi:hypothetical protein